MFVVSLLVLSISSTIMGDLSENLVTLGNAHFANGLFEALSNTDDNLIFSPISVHTALSMVFQGADGTTAESLAKTLQVPNEPKTVAEDYKSIITSLNNVENVTLLMANKLFVQEKVELQDTFNSTLSNHFLSELQKVDFANNTEAAQTINSWVEEKTENKIKDLIQPDALYASTQLVLVNAIYFKGDWQTKFDKSATRIEPFFLNDSEKVDVQMMFITTADTYFNLKYDQDLNAQILELPYTNEDLRMVIILPNQKTGIKALKTKLATVNLTNLTDKMYKEEVLVYLPKFKIESTMDLEKPLTEMGLGVIFDQERANFSKITGDNIYVSKVIQKAFIEVNEDGTEAAAATGVEVRPASLPPTFKADHPFVFVLFASEVPIFVGQVTNPNDGSK